MSLYKQPGGSVWWMDINVPGHQRIRESTGETRQSKAQAVHDIRKGTLRATKTPRGVKWSNAVAQWVQNKNPSADEMASLMYFGQHFPDRLLATITPEIVDKTLSAFCKTASTYNRHRARVSGILHAAGLDIDLIKREEPVMDEPDWLTHEQWDRLYAELRPHMKPMALFAITTGLRQGNVLGLQWGKVDLERRLVRVTPIQAKAKKAIPVPLSDEALAVLHSVKGQHPEFCFTYKGEPIGEIKTSFMAACVRAGVGRIDESGHYTGFTWHGFRHTWATWHVQNGTPLDVLQKLGGWADYKMVLRYSHHSAGYLANFVNNTTKGKI